MKWWHIIIALPSLYPLVSLGPWIVLRVIEWQLQRAMGALVELEKRLRGLEKAHAEHADAWPLEVRLGRYQEPDRRAQQYLYSLGAAVDDAQHRWPRLAFYAPSALGLAEILSLRSWAPVAEALRVWRDMSVIQEILRRGEEALKGLLEQERIVEDIPNGMRAELNDVRVEIRRLGATIQTERQAGTPGLEKVALELQEAEAATKASLTALALAEPGQMPEVVSETDEVLVASRQVVGEVDRWLGEAEAERNRAYDLIDHVNARLRLAEKRWQDLKTRGASESSIDEALVSLSAEAGALADVAQQKTREAYEQVNTEGHGLHVQMNAFMDLLEGLEETMIRSEQSIEGVRQGIASLQGVCDELQSQDPPIDPREALTLLDRAVETRGMAESLHGYGTLEGYETAITLSQAIMQDLDEAEEAARGLPEKARAARELLNSVSEEELGNWRERAGRVREALARYTQHWKRYLASDAGKATSYLGLAEIDLERISVDLRYQRRFPQYELDEAVAILSHARECMDGAQELVGRLEGERERIESLRQSLENRVEELSREILPAMRELGKSMLPELQVRLSALVESFEGKVRELDNPANLDYDEAMGEWLPSIERELEELRTEHDRSIHRYRAMWQKAVCRIDEKWARLLESRPGHQLDPDEEFGGLAQDLDVWRAEAQRQLDDPLALQDIVDGRATVLEQRIEEAYRQDADTGLGQGMDHPGQTYRDMESVGGSSDAILGTLRDPQEPNKPVSFSESAAIPAIEADMAAMLGEPATSEADPRYQEGMAHLQAGEWREAIRCLEALSRAYPDSERVQRALADARFEARLDATTQVKARRWIVPWRRVAIYLAIAAAVGTLALVGVRTVRHQIVPAMAQAKVEGKRAELLAESHALLERGDLDGAEARYRELLAQVPTHDEALRGLERSAAQRELLDLYGQAVAVQEAGDHGAAMAKLEQISMSSPGYRDVEQRMARIGREQELARVFGEAEADREAGRYEEALGKYEQVEALDAGYWAEEIVERRYEAHMALGQELIGGDGATSEAVGEAVEHFGEALALKPRSGEAALERRLARLYLEGEARYREGDWDGAVAQLRGVYGRRPGYLGGTMVEMLYEAYVWSGDAHRSAGDRQFAYEQYRRAAALPVEDNTLALSRAEALAPKQVDALSATPTPKPLAARGDHIAFFSDSQDGRGLWVMDPSGGGRLYLGDSEALRTQYDALVEETRRSPDERSYLSVRDVEGSSQIFVLESGEGLAGDAPSRQLTSLTACRDPIWSPDGRRIAFVSKQDGSDDIWVMNADGSEPRNLTQDSGGSDDHPSWSPDGSQIVFRSDREGHRHIHVMDADGRNVSNISNTEWPEYDPIWIR